MRRTSRGGWLSRLAAKRQKSWVWLPEFDPQNRKPGKSAPVTPCEYRAEHGAPICRILRRTRPSSHFTSGGVLRLRTSTTRSGWRRTPPCVSFRRPRRLPVPCRTRKVATRAILNRASALPSTAGAVATLQSPQHVAKGQCRSLLNSTGPPLGPAVHNPTPRLVVRLFKEVWPPRFLRVSPSSGQHWNLPRPRAPGHDATGSTRHTRENPNFHL